MTWDELIDRLQQIPAARRGERAMMGDADNNHEIDDLSLQTLVCPSDEDEAESWVGPFYSTVGNDEDTYILTP